MASIVCKVTDGAQVRRLVLPADADFATTADAARAALGVPGTVCALSYVDEDGDEVTVRADSDVAAAVAWAQASGRALKFRIPVAATGAATTVAAAGDDNNEEVRADVDDSATDDSDDDADDDDVVEFDLGPLAAALPALLEQVGHAAPEVAVQLSEAVQRARTAGAPDVSQLISALLPNVEVVLREGDASEGNAAAATAAGDAIGAFVRDILGGGAEPTPAGDASAAPAAVSASEPEPPVHRGVRCDSCDAVPIRGVRYKCSVCPDYDLDAACEAAGVHAHHALIKIVAPDQTFRHFGNMPHPHPHMPRGGCGRPAVRFGQPAGASGACHPHPFFAAMMQARAKGLQAQQAAQQEQQEQQEQEQQAQQAAQQAQARDLAAAAAAAAVAEAERSAAEPEPEPVTPMYLAEQSHLASMGFTDTAMNARLLDEHHGNLRLVVPALLASGV